MKFTKIIIVLNGILILFINDINSEPPERWDDSEWEEMPYLEGLSETGLSKGMRTVYPERFCLADENVALSPTHSSFQGDYSTCWAFSTIHALEIEVKKLLISTNVKGGYELPYSTFNINLSERQLIELYKYHMYSETFERGLYWIDGKEPELHGDLHRFAVNRIARNHWIIPLEGDNCYSPCCSHIDGVNSYIRPPDYPFERTSNADIGVEIIDEAGYAAARVANKYNEATTELAIKHTLLVSQKGVLVSIRTKGHDSWDYIDWPTEKDKETNHSVCIIGWNDNAVVVDYVQGHDYIERDFGKAWIVKNSKGKAHMQAPRTLENWFYMKMEGDIANESKFFVINSPIKIHGEEQFINRLYDAYNLDCNDDDLSRIGWCGTLEEPNKVPSSFGDGRLGEVTKSFDASLTGFTSTEGDVIAAGMYNTTRYQLIFSITYWGTDLMPYFDYTHGANDSPRISYPWCGILSINEHDYMRSDAKLVTYVYKVGCKVDGTFCAGTWFPCPPEKACVGVLYTPLENPGCYNPFAPTSIGYMDKNKNKK